MRASHSSAEGPSDEPVVCAKCRSSQRRGARFCARCGAVLDPVEADLPPIVRMVHPRPLPCPAGMTACQGASDLYFRMESSWGGGMPLGSETLAIVLFNGGYPMEAALLEVTGVGGAEGRPFTVRHEVESLPRGEVVLVELPSYELPDDPRQLRVNLVMAMVE